MLSIESPAMKWLKMWTEARNDSKLRVLTDYQHRVWFRLICYATEQEPPGTVRAPWKVIAAEVADGNIQALQDACNEFHSLRLVTCVTRNTEDVEIAFPAYAKRQKKYPSEAKEAVAARVAKCRGNKKLRKSPKAVTTSNEFVTGKNDSETDTEIEEKTPPTPSEGAVCVNRPSDPEPNPQADAVADWAESVRPGERWGTWVREQIVVNAYDPSWVRKAIAAASAGEKLTKGYVAAILKRYAAQGGPDPDPPPSKPGGSKASAPAKPVERSEHAVYPPVGKPVSKAEQIEMYKNDPSTRGLGEFLERRAKEWGEL